MSTYKVGFSEDTWNFNQAYEAMSDGDTIELEEGLTLTPENGEYIIKKNINIVGNFSIQESGENMYNTTLQGRFVIDGAKVAISALRIASIDEKGCALWGKNKATISVKDCQFQFEVKSNAYALLFDSKSTATLDGVYVSITDESPYSIVARGESQLKIENSSVVKVAIIKSEATLNNTTLRGRRDNNSFYGDSSKLSMKATTIHANHVTRPAFWCKSTTVLSEDSEVLQPQYGGGAIYLSENSSLVSKADRLTSIWSQESRIVLEQTTINEFINLSDHSYGKSTGSLDIWGQNANKVDFLVNEGSTLIAEYLTLHRLCNPNIRLSEQSFLNAEQLQYPEGKVDDLKFEVDDTSISQTKSTTSEATEKVQAVTQQAAEEGHALEELNALVGLKRVKTEVDKMIKVVNVNKQRQEQGFPPIKQSLHTVFMGNPGTGKTEVAKLVGRALFENGVLSGDKLNFVSVTETDLVANIIGGTKINTTKKLEEAKGGVLFIDEAYTLNKKGSSTNFGQEAIDTIMEYMESHRDEIMIIFAGYRKEMEEFLRTNPGLQSRVQHTWLFDDYTPDQIVAIGKQILAKDKFKLEDDAYYERNVAQAYKASLDNSNARWIRKFNEELTGVFAMRVAAEGSSNVSTIMNSDIDELLGKDKFVEGDSEDALSELQHLIGIQSAKEQVAEFIAKTEWNKKREERGEISSQSTLHSLFLGNPGTGKTTVAKLLGKIMYQKDIIKQNKYIKATRSDLVAGYTGQTAIKTREVLMSALGGVLFIDEAYNLYSGPSDSFGIESINEILEFMEEHRQDIVIIFAGYTKEMNEFLKANSGLASRIPNKVTFEDYTTAELIQIGELGLQKESFEYDQKAYAEAVMAAYAITDDHSNGRWIRNFNDKLTGFVSTRVMREQSDDLSTITSDDIQNVREAYHV